MVPAPAFLIGNQLDVKRDTITHEAAHVAAALVLGFVFDEVALDVKYHDYGWLGAVKGVRRKPVDVVPIEADSTAALRAAMDGVDEWSFAEHRARCVVSMAAPLVTFGEGWDAPTAAGDRENVERWRPQAYSPALWEMVVEQATRKLLRRDDFHDAHGAIMAALGSTNRLSYDECAEIVQAAAG